jgi:hypothetical protein
MPYTAEISRQNPSCFLFLIDQSTSMQDVLDPTNVQALEQPQTVDGRTYTHSAVGRTKAQGVADAINKLLSTLIIKSAKEEGIRPYFDIGVIGYGAQVGHVFAGPLAGREMVPISDVGNNPARVEERKKKVDDGAGGIVEQIVRFPVWFDPVANGGTPMCRALELARHTLEGWLAKHPNSYPPIIVNITDGEANDGDPEPAAEALRLLSTNDGNVLLYNVHISSAEGEPIEFPDAEERLPDKFAQLLFRMSSRVPSFTRSEAQREGFRVSEETRGFVFKSDMVSLIRFLDIGTRPSDLR